MLYVLIKGAKLVVPFLLSKMEALRNFLSDGTSEFGMSVKCVICDRALTNNEHLKSHIRGEIGRPFLSS